jgi:uncharacterized protein (DUF302 family)
MMGLLVLGLVATLMTAVPPSPPGIVSRKSPYSSAETIKRLEAALRERGLTVFARVDHAAGAKAVGLSLRPTEVLLFGNPKAGTPLMQSRQEIGLDLPLKVLVWEDDRSQTWLTYADPAWLVERYGISDRATTASSMSATLRALADAATR